MTRPLVEAVLGRPTDRTPVWAMRQAGRHLPEYRALREKVGFKEAVSTPEIAAEITLQPIERYGMDGAVIFADIMTPLAGMGIEIDFAPGPKLRPHTLDEVAALPVLDPDRVGYVAETVRLVRKAVPDETAVVGFAGAPLTLLGYLVEGGGSRDFVSLRAALRRDPGVAVAALANLAVSMRAYLAMQTEAGADVVQLFDSWAGVVDVETYRAMAIPAARAALDLDAPTIYFAPHASHTLTGQMEVGADCYGVDWRLPVDVAWDRLGSRAVQGNLDPAVLLTDADTIATEVGEIKRRVGERSGHVFNLGLGVDPRTPPENVKAMVEAVRS